MAYTKTMSIFVLATDAKRPKSQLVTVASLVLAAIFIVLSVSQLFTYEDFPSILGDYWLPGDAVGAHLTAALLVTTEVFALPFLLRMRLSPLMRFVSLLCGWLATIAWLKLSLWAVLTTNALTNGGLLGATIRLSPGWWQVIFSALLLGLVGYVSYGLWPSGSFRRTK